MARLIRFGGPNLPVGPYSTWYDHRNPDGSYGGQISVRAGHVVAADRVGGEITVELKDGSTETFCGKTAAYYVDSGRATWVDEDEEPARPAEG